MAVNACRNVRIHPPASVFAYSKNDNLRNSFSSSIPLLEYRQITNVLLRINLVPNLEVDGILAPARKLAAALSGLLAVQKPSQSSISSDLLATCSIIFVSEPVRSPLSVIDDISLGVTCSLIIVTSYGLPIVSGCTTWLLRHYR